MSGSVELRLQVFVHMKLHSSRYYGKLEFAEGLWCGVELDEPTGKNNGSVRGIRYFSCEQHYGIFVQLSRVELDTSRRPSKSRTASISRSASQSSLSGLPAPQKKLSVPGAVTSYRPSKTLPHLQRRQKGGILKKSSSEWDLLGSRSTTTESSEGLSSGRKSEKGSYSDLKSAVSNGGERKDTVERKRQLFRPSASCMNLITIKTSKKCSLPGEEKKEGERMRPQHNSIFSWPRTSTPQQSRGGGSNSSCSSNSSISDSDHTPHSFSSSSVSPVSTKVEHSPTPNLPLTPATAERAFVVSPDDVFTSSSTTSAMRAPVPTGLTTPVVQAMESVKVTGGESLSTYLDLEQSPTRRYHNKQSGMATLNHPLRVANGHGQGGQVLDNCVSEVCCLATNN